MEWLQERVRELSESGLCCSQVVMTIVGLDPRGEENPDLIKAMRAYGYGMYKQYGCGALCGGAAALAIYADEDVEKAKNWIKQLVTWFEGKFGGGNCADVIGKGSRPAPICREAMAATADWCLKLLEEQGML